jgi:hypothetical protein
MIVLVLLTEQHFQLDLPHWRTRVSRHNPMKGELGRLQLDCRDPKLLHRGTIEQIDAAAGSHACFSRLPILVPLYFSWLARRWAWQLVEPYSRSLVKLH